MDPSGHQPAHLPRYPPARVLEDWRLFRLSASHVLWNGEPFQPLGGPFHLPAPNPPASWCSGVPYSLHTYWGHRRVGALGALACPLAVESRALSATIFPPAVSPGPLLPLSVPQSVLCAGDLGETSGQQPTTNRIPGVLLDLRLSTCCRNKGPYSAKAAIDHM